MMHKMAARFNTELGPEDQYKDCFLGGQHRVTS